MQISVPYGTSSLSAEIDDSIEVQLVDPPAEPVREPVEVLLQNALDSPINSKRLEELVTPDDKVTIIVNDHTRPGPNALIIGEIVKRLGNAGIPDSQIQFVVATGSHRASTPQELDKILGADIRQRISVHNHDCSDKQNMAYVGETVSGMPLWVNKIVAEASFIVTTGLIAPHHSAGFSGGRKSIVPGVAGIDTLKIHHSLPIRPFDPAMGFLEGNRFHEAALEAAQKMNVRFMVNAVQDPHKQNIAFVAGELEAAHAKGVEICRAANTIEFDSLADIVVASPGGYPRDGNLYQAQKALSVAEILGKRGECTLILCARCEDGIGEGLFQQWMEEAKTPEEIIDRFREVGYDVGNNKAFMFARALTKGQVIIVTENIGEETLSNMMLGWAPDLQTALDKAIRNKKPQKIIVLPRAVNMIPKLVKA